MSYLIFEEVYFCLGYGEGIDQNIICNWYVLYFFYLKLLEF